jgi:hypothetical protein
MRAFMQVTQGLVPHVHRHAFPYMLAQGGGAQGGWLLGAMQRFSGENHDGDPTFVSHAVPLPFSAQAKARRAG